MKTYLKYFEVHDHKVSLKEVRKYDHAGVHWQLYNNEINNFEVLISDIFNKFTHHSRPEGKTKISMKSRKRSLARKACQVYNSYPVQEHSNISLQAT